MMPLFGERGYRALADGVWCDSSMKYMEAHAATGEKTHEAVHLGTGHDWESLDNGLVVDVGALLSTIV
jgi:hypothetical protein